MFIKNAIFDTKHLFIDNGTTEYSIVVPKEMNEYEIKAISEFKYLLNKYVHTSGGKRRLFKRADRVLLFLHEPCGPVDLKAYEDLMML